MLIFLYFWKYAIKQARHKSEVTDVKKKVKRLILTVLTVSLLSQAAGCRIFESARTGTSQTLNTNEYNIVVPTGTVVASNEKDLPKGIVYWDPTRSLQEKYTFDEALKKYAIVVGHSTLIYTHCDELWMTHDFYCVDYGNNRFRNDNGAYFLDSDGKDIVGLANHADLYESGYATLSEFTENLGQLYVGNMGYYSPEDPNGPKITIVEQTSDHIFATVKKEPPYADEALFYGTVINGTVFYSKFKVYLPQDELTDKDRENFARYSKILFEHLSPDDHTEPYIYDKLVNTPLLDGKHIAGFDYIYEIAGRTIVINTKKDSKIEYLTIMSGAEDRFLAKEEYHTDWTDINGMKVRDFTQSNTQQFVFTIGGTRYLCNLRGRDDKKIKVDSLDALLKLINGSSYMK